MGFVENYGLCRKPPLITKGYVHLFLKRWNEWLRLIWHQCVLLKENNGYLLFLNCFETIWNGFEATIKDILMTTKTVDSAVWEKKISLEASVCLLQVSKCFELSCQIALGISQMYIWLKVNWKKADSKRPWKWCAFYFVITKTPQNYKS